MTGSNEGVQDNLQLIGREAHCIMGRHAEREAIYAKSKLNKTHSEIREFP